MVGGPVSEPQKADGPVPAYPAAARRAGIQGVVVLELVITEDGQVADLKELRGLPLGLTEAVLDAVRQWRFSPGTLDGQPVVTRYLLSMRFKLNEAELAAVERPETEMLELSFPGKESATRDLVAAAGRALHLRLAAEMPDDVALRTVIARPGVLYINGTAASDAALRSFMANLEASPFFTKVALESSTSKANQLWFFRVSVTPAE